ncbi:MAG TPA: SDR family NAD(P)-dependent oxidoreductase, partial [Bacteroidia bacterium]
MKTTGNTILITGGSSGIGLGFAQEFLKLGNKVIICGRSLEKLNEAKKNNPELIIRQCNVASAQQREDLHNWIKTNHPEVNLLINNAGVQLHTNITSPSGLKRMQEEVDTNFIAPIQLSALFVELLKTKTEAAIINISSGLAFAPLAFMSVYCSTKAALHSYSLSLRHQLKKT